REGGGGPAKRRRARGARRRRAVGHDGARRPGGVDSSSHALVRRHRLRVRDHPRRVPRGTRDRKRVRGLLASARRQRPPQLRLEPALLLGASLLANVLPHASPSASTPVRALHALHVLRAIDVVLPAAVLWGMSFPFALAAGRGHADAAQSTGSIYAANTVGAIV